MRYQGDYENDLDGDSDDISSIIGECKLVKEINKSGK